MDRARSANSGPHIEHCYKGWQVSRGSHGKHVRSFDQLFTETKPRIATINLVQ
jgi:hypothetical protein